MGSLVYDFLADSLLFDNELIEDTFRKVKENDLTRELTQYHELMLSSIRDITTELEDTDSKIKIFSGLKMTSLELIKQTALYVDQFVIPDPLFSLTSRPGKIDGHMRKLLNLKRFSIDRHQLASSCAYLKQLAPAVAADYIKFSPVSYLSPPPIQFPVFLSPDQIGNDIPAALLNHFHKHAVVRSLERVNDGWIEKPALYPCGAIAVRFRNHDPVDTQMMLFLKSRVEPLAEGARMTYCENQLHDEPPNLEEFNSWVIQSVNEIGRSLYSQTSREMAIGNSFAASYLCRSEFVFDMIGITATTRNDSAIYTQKALVNLELPFLDKVDLQTLMRVRCNDGDAFEKFRSTLAKKLLELRLEKDLETARKKAANVVKELTELQVRDLALTLKTIRKRALADTVVLMAGFTGALLAGGFQLPVAVMATAQAYRTYQSYREKVLEQPAYFLWKILKKSGS